MEKNTKEGRGKASTTQISSADDTDDQYLLSDESDEECQEELTRQENTHLEDFQAQVNLTVLLFYNTIQNN
jgi:hypothetical protein